MDIFDLPDFDPECINLVRVMNLVPGLQTTESCCGHGKSPYHIWFEIGDNHWLFPLGRCLSRNYGGSPFRCELTISDLPDRPVAFLLTSGDLRGEEAYAEADRVAAMLLQNLRWGDMLKMFGLPLPVFPVQEYYAALEACGIDDSIPPHQPVPGKTP